MFVLKTYKAKQTMVKWVLIHLLESTDFFNISCYILCESFQAKFQHQSDKLDGLVSPITTEETDPAHYIGGCVVRNLQEKDKKWRYGTVSSCEWSDNRKRALLSANSRRILRKHPSRCRMPDAVFSPLNSMTNHKLIKITVYNVQCCYNFLLLNK